MEQDGENVPSLEDLSTIRQLWHRCVGVDYRAGYLVRKFSNFTVKISRKTAQVTVYLRRNVYTYLTQPKLCVKIANFANNVVKLARTDRGKNDCGAVYQTGNFNLLQIQGILVITSDSILLRVKLFQFLKSEFGVLAKALDTFFLPSADFRVSIKTGPSQETAFVSRGFKLTTANGASTVLRFFPVSHKATFVTRNTAAAEYCAKIFLYFLDYFDRERKSLEFEFLQLSNSELRRHLIQRYIDLAA